jgi:hypothetical protein
VETLALRMAMEARFKLMEDEVHLCWREKCKDYRVPVDAASIEADIERHCESVVSTRTSSCRKHSSTAQREH